MTEMIGAIGDGRFVAATADALRRYVGFDLAAVVLHRTRPTPALLFDNFDTVGARKGLDNYVRVTHRINPILDRAPIGSAVRARDYAIDSAAFEAQISDYLVPAPDEELGFRTVGWPERLEEIALHFHAWGGTIELSFYRERGASAAHARILKRLDALNGPITAAFERHHSLAPRVAGSLEALSARENEVCTLLLDGCSSEAIALRLSISAHTVKDHRKSIFRKLGISSLAELFARLH